MGSQEPRVSLLTRADVDEETGGMLSALGELNIFRALAHHPKLMKRWLVFGGHVLNKSTLDARRRELAILRVGWRCGSEYEFGQHTVIALREGISDDEIRRCTAEQTSTDSGWSTDERLLLAATDELIDEYEISDITWTALGEHYSTEQIMDLVFLVGQYTLTCMALKSLRVPLDEGTPGFPA
jgi:4-carboxymuconolactone decarboxylase